MNDFCVKIGDLKQTTKIFIRKETRFGVITKKYY